MATNALGTTTGGASTAGSRLEHGRVVARLSRWIESATNDAGLSLPQYRLLALLADGSSAAKHLAAGLHISPPSVTTLVDGLVDRGLVERRRESDDRRRVEHSITESGRAALDAADDAIDARLVELTAHLSERDAKRARDALNLWAVALDANRAVIVSRKIERSE